MEKKQQDAAAVDPAVEETPVEVAQEPTLEPTPEEVAVAEAAKKVAEAAVAHADAKAQLDAAKAEHAAVLKAAEPVAELGKHVYVQFGGTVDYVLREVPGGYTVNERVLRLDGRNVEHVAEDPATGVWCYREM